MGVVAANNVVSVASAHTETADFSPQACCGDRAPFRSDRDSAADLLLLGRHAGNSCESVLLEHDGKMVAIRDDRGRLLLRGISHRIADCSLDWFSDVAGDYSLRISLLAWISADLDSPRLPRFVGIDWTAACFNSRRGANTRIPLMEGENIRWRGLFQNNC